MVLRSFQNVTAVSQASQPRNGIEEVVNQTTSLVVDLLLVDGRLALLLVPADPVLLVQPGVLVRDGDDARRVLDLLPADAALVARDPEQGGLRGDGRVEVRVALDLGRVRGGLQVVRDEAAEGRVVSVPVRAEEPEDGVRLLLLLRLRSSCQALLDAVGRGLAALPAEQRLLLHLHVLGNVVDEWIHRLVQRHVVEDGENEEDDHQDQGTKGPVIGSHSDGEQADETAFKEVAASRCLLQSTDVDHALRVDVSVRDVQQVVSVGEVEEIQANGRESENQRRDAGVSDRWKNNGCCQQNHHRNQL